MDQSRVPGLGRPLGPALVSDRSHEPGPLHTGGIALRLANRFAGLATALIMAVVSLVPEREHRLLLGRPGDHTSVDGFSLGSEHLGVRGRWSRGEGVVRFAPYPGPASIALRVTPPDERAPDTIEIVVNGTSIHRVTLAAGWNELEVPLRPPFLPDGITLRIRSAVTRPPEGPPRGVFVEHVTVTTGGIPALRHTPLETMAKLAVLFLALMGFAAWNTRAVPTRAQSWLVLLVVLLLAMVALVMFRMWLLPHLLLVMGLCWAAALATAVIGTERVRRWYDEPPRKGLATLTFVLAAILLVCALFPEALTKGYVLSQADMLYEFFPWRAHLPAGYRAIDRPPLGDIPMVVHPFFVFTKASWLDGVFPLWTNAMSSGQPFLATYHSALFSPFTWILTVVPLPQATVVIAMVRLLVGGIGMFVFLRALGLSRWVATFGGITFLLNPFMVTALEHPVADAPPWLPWMLLAGERVASRRAGASLALAVTLALALTGGHPQTGLFVAVFGGSYAVLGTFASTRRVRATVMVLAVLGLGVTLAAAQIVPFLEYLSLSRALEVRAGHELNPYFSPAATLITAIIPNFLGHHNSGNFAGPTNYLEQQIYPGIVTWVLAGVGLVHNPRSWRAWFFAAAALLGMLVMYAAPGIHWVISSLPLIKAAALQRLAVVPMASLAVLAAFGLEQVLRGERTRRAAWVSSLTLCLTTATIAVIAIGTLRGRMPFLESQGLVEFTTAWTAIGLWLACAACAMAVARVQQGIRRPAAALALNGFVVVDLLLFGRGFHPMTPSPHVFPVVPEIELVKQDPELFRVMGLGNALLPNAAMVYGLQDVRGTDAIDISRYTALLEVIFKRQQLLLIAEGIHSPLIDLLNVKYVFGVPNIQAPEGWFTKLTEGEAPVYRNNRVFPRAFLVDGYLVQDGNPARRTLRDGLVDFHRIALVEQELPDHERPVTAASSDGVGTASVVHYDDHRVEIRTVADERRLLVLTDVHYPGWEVAIDGQPASLYRANFAFRAVSVPAGSHTVTFEYRPGSVRVGLAISLGALLMLVGLGAYEWRRPAPINESLTAEPAAVPPDPSR